MAKYTGKWNDLTKSKRFHVVVVDLLLMALIAVSPMDPEAQEIVTNGLLTFGIWLVGGYSLQDAAAAWKSNGK